MSRKMLLLLVGLGALSLVLALGNVSAGEGSGGMHGIISFFFV